MSEVDPVNRCNRCDSYLLTERTGVAIIARHDKLLRVIEVQKKALEFYTDAPVPKLIQGWCDDGQKAREALAEAEKILGE